MAAIQGYRRLLKSAKFAFKADKFAYIEARKELKTQFLKNKNISDKDEISHLLKGVDEIDEMLRFHIVQGTLNGRGNYGEHKTKIGYKLK